MIENTLARKVLIKVSPKFALKRSTEIVYTWIRDMWANPDKYRAAILTAPVSDQPKLNRMLELYLQCAHIDIHRPPAELESEMQSLGKELETALLIQSYFQDRRSLQDEFMDCMEVVTAAGLYP